MWVDPGGIIRKILRRPAPMVTSASGLLFIASFEGFAGVPYNDPTGNATVGYGHLIHYGRVTSADQRQWGTVTRQLAVRLLRNDLARYEAAVRRCVKVPLQQYEFDALVSFAFNCGEGALATSSAVRELNNHNRRAVPGALMLWDHDGHGNVIPGLYRRRTAEGLLFSTGRYR